MSSSKASSSSGADKAPKRALPSWISARNGGNGGNGGNGDKQDDDSQAEASSKKVRGQGKGVKDIGEDSGSRKKSEFSNLLEGVVFALSGFVNPERGILRSQALEMGAEYQPDWNSNCTLLVCAFPNTPKFRQVEADGGTIVSKDWVAECYTQKKLVDIETFLMHIGKPWKKNNTTHTGNEVFETSLPNNKCHMQDVKPLEVEPLTFCPPRELRDNTSIYTDKISSFEVKRWAFGDLKKTITWLESQEEKPEPNEIRSVAAEWILTCLQDAMDLLKNEQDLKQLTEQWNMVPRVVEELIELQSTEGSSSILKDGLHKQAHVYKMIYEGILKGEMACDCSKEKSGEPRFESHDTGKGKHSSTDDIASSSMHYDSDETIEMTEDEIKDAYSSLASKIPS